MKIVKQRFAVSICLAIFIVLAMGLLRPESDYSGISEEKFWSTKILWEQQFNIVAAGDSRTLQNVNPAAMNEILPELKIANYGFGSCGFTQKYNEYVENLLVAHGRRIILLGITPLSLTPRAGRENRFLEWAEIKEQNPAKLKGTPLSGILQFFRRYERDEADLILRNEQGLEKIHYKNGWMASSMKTEDRQFYIRLYRQTFVHNRVSSGAIETLMNQIKKWTDEGIMVIGYRPPTTTEMVELENRKSAFDEEEIKRRLVEGGGHWLTFPLGKYNCYDGSHLRYDSATQFSKDLADRIKKLISKPQ